jgi:large subunit ribosomal protein L22
MKAYLKQFNQAPRKIRLVANAVRGKKVATALTNLKFGDRKSAEAIAKLISSAGANSGLTKEQQGELVVKDIRVDEAVKMKRFMPRAMGRAAAFYRVTSHITVVLAEAVVPKPKKGAGKKTIGKKKVAEAAE